MFKITLTNGTEFLADKLVITGNEFLYMFDLENGESRYIVNCRLELVASIRLVDPIHRKELTH